MEQEVFDQPLEPGKKLTIDFRINRRVRVTDLASGMNVEFTVIAGHAFTLTAGTARAKIDLFDADTDVPLGEVRLADDPNTT